MSLPPQQKVNTKMMDEHLSSSDDQPAEAGLVDLMPPLAERGPGKAGAVLRGRQQLRQLKQLKQMDMTKGGFMSLAEKPKFRHQIGQQILQQQQQQNQQQQHLSRVENLKMQKQSSLPPQVIKPSPVACCRGLPVGRGCCRRPQEQDRARSKMASFLPSLPPTTTMEPGEIWMPSGTAAAPGRGAGKREGMGAKCYRDENLPPLVIPERRAKSVPVRRARPDPVRRSRSDVVRRADHPSPDQEQAEPSPWNLLSDSSGLNSGGEGGKDDDEKKSEPVATPVSIEPVRDISPPDQKGKTEASTEESSEDECSDQDPVPGTVTEGPGPDGTGACPPLCCEKCQLVQITPEISHGRLLALLDGEGTYECTVTGLVFEVTQKAEMRYSVLSWSKYEVFLKDSWKFAGPIFDVDCDPSILTSIQFPHSLCLAGLDGEVTFSVLHVKSGRGLVMPSAGHSGNRVMWRVTSLSPVGPIVRTSQPAVYHGVVLIYREVETRASSSFHVYMAANTHSEIEDIRNEVHEKKFKQMYKSPNCNLEEQKMYRLNSEPEGEITPKNLEFTSDVLKLKKYFEVFLEKRPPFELKLSLVEADSGQIVWTATLRKCDFVDNADEKSRERTETGRKRSSSTSEEDVLISKRARHRDVPGDFVDNADEKSRERTETGRKRSSSTSEEDVLISKRARHRDVPGDFVDNADEKSRERTETGRKRSSSTSEEDVLISKRARHRDVPDGVMKTPGINDQQLMKLAMRMGKEWKQLGILYLGMTNQDIEEIEATDEILPMLKFKMLDRWRRRVKGKASVSLLCRSLSDVDVPIELRELLEDMLSNPPAK